MIVIKPLTEAFPSSGFDTPKGRAASLLEAGSNYLATVEFLRHKNREIGPLFNVMLPSMHQALELLSKAVAYKVDPEFRPRNYSHGLLQLITDYSNQAPVFQGIMARADAVALIAALEQAYSGVRYGECFLSYDAEDHDLFVDIAYGLLAQLHDLGFGFAFPHWISPEQRSRLADQLNAGDAEVG
ncbi:MAG: hypothetical protein V4864_18705 [Pseudomonadota bacterium]